ncbi:MAG TPA: caspase family protein [Chroococcidiopsis sp.]
MLVGVNHYQDETLPSLRYSAPDCQGLGVALADATQAFPKKEVYIYHDFAPQLPTLKTVRDRLQHIVAAAAPEDTLLLYFSGHGVLSAGNQQVVLCLTDTDGDRLLDTGLPLSELLHQLESCAAHQQLIWLDACHSGGLTLRGGREAEPMRPNPTPQLVDLLRQRAARSKGFYALLSCDQSQRSWEFPELGHGVFTYYLMQGLQGEAADGQGVIEADGLYKYVYHQTLRYIDKTNQQIRLVNQQKSSRGDTQFQSEYPLQTPKRIVEGVGELVIGIQSAAIPETATAKARLPHPRQALIIEGFTNSPLTLELSKTLRADGAFDIDYFPRPGQDWSNLRATIQASLSQSQATTVLLYLRGRLEETAEGESWFLVGDVRLHCSWLRQMLRQAAAAQHIIILDCPGAVSLLHWMEEFQLGADQSQCLIAAAASPNQPDQFTRALLDTLQQADRQVGLPVAAWITQLRIWLAGTSISLFTWLSASNGVIEVLPGRLGAKMANIPEAIDLGVCPYMGLRSFSEEQANYFYGREALTQQLIAAIAERSAIAVVGASGSGKSSVVQAGLIAQLRQGNQVPGSDQWWFGCMRPGRDPIAALARRLVDPGSEKERAYQQLQIEGLLYQGVEGWVRWLRTRPEPMVVLVIDQFEELFTLTAEIDRAPFLDLILGALPYVSDRFKLVLTLRTDFIAPCLEIPALAELLQHASVLVPPSLSQDNYRQVIIRPAEQVGLQIEPGLVEVLLSELHQTTSHLPLLEFVLEQLWERRQQGKLTLSAYQQLGGLRGALERQAQTVYDRLDPDAQACAQWIFLNLTQLGEGTEDTRRRVQKTDLIVAKYPADRVEQTLQILTAAKLVTVGIEDDWTQEITQGNQRGVEETPAEETLAEETSANLLKSSGTIAWSAKDVTIEVVHEILIRHWSTLRWWLEENRARLRLQRQLERSAQQWQQHGHDQDDLLRGGRLAEAETLYVNYTDELSTVVQQFIEAGLAERHQQERQAKQRLRRAQLAAGLIGGLGLVAIALGGLAYRQQLAAQVEGIQALDASSEAMLASNQPLEALLASVKAGRQLQTLPLASWLLDRSTWTIAQLKTVGTLQQAVALVQELNRFEQHTQAVNVVRFSPDGHLLASASDDGRVILWHPNGQILTTLPPLNPNQRMVSLAFSPDSQWLATGASDGTLALWQIEGETVRLLKRFKGHQDWISSLSFSPDGQRLVSGSRDRTLKLWRRDGTLINILKGHQGWVNAASFSPDGKTIASASEDQTIRLWQAEGRLIKILKGHSDRVTSLAFTADSQGLISSGGDRTLRRWNLSQGGSQVLSNSVAANSISIRPTDGTAIATADDEGQVQLWRQDGLLLQTFVGHGGHVLSVQFSPDGHELVSASADKTIRLWQVPTRSDSQDDSIYTARFIAQLPHEQQFATAGFNGDIKIWKQTVTGDRTLIRILKGDKSAITAIDLNPNGEILAASADRQIKLWHVRDGTLGATLQGHSDRVTSVAFSPDGTLIASGSNDKTVKLWRNGALLTSLQGHTDGVTSVAFSPDGQTIASSSYDRTAKLWRLDGTLLTTIPLSDAGFAVRFSPDGRWLAIATQDNTIQLHAVQQGNGALQATHILSGHSGGVISLSFSHDSQTLASSSADGTVRLWSVSDGALIKTLHGHTTRVNTVQFSADDQALLSGDDNGTVILWTLNLNQLMQQGCNHLSDYLQTNSQVDAGDRTLCSE